MRFASWNRTETVESMELTGDGFFRFPTQVPKPIKKLHRLVRGQWCSLSVATFCLCPSTEVQDRKGGEPLRRQFGELEKEAREETLRRISRSARPTLYSQLLANLLPPEDEDRFPLR
jgi:hypothetical protein